MNAADSTSMLKMTKISTELRDERRWRQPAASQCAPTGVFARAPVGRHRAAPFAHVRLELGAEVLHRRQRRRRRGVAERAQRLADDVVADADQQVDVAHLPFAALDPGEDLEQPVAALAARRALAARLVLVEMQQVARRPHHAGRLVHHDDAGRAEHRPRLRHVVEAGRDVELIGQQDRHRRSAGDDRLELMRRRGCRRRNRRSAPSASSSSSLRRRPAS